MFASEKSFLKKLSKNSKISRIKNEILKLNINNFNTQVKSKKNESCCIEKKHNRNNDLFYKNHEDYFEKNKELKMY